MPSGDIEPEIHLADGNYAQFPYHFALSLRSRMKTGARLLPFSRHWASAEHEYLLAVRLKTCKSFVVSRVGAGQYVYHFRVGDRWAMMHTPPQQKIFPGKDRILIPSAQKPYLAWLSALCSSGCAGQSVLPQKEKSKTS